MTLTKQQHDDAAFIRFHRRNVIFVMATLVSLALGAALYLSQHIRLI